jgi:hypothetical protein
METFTFAGRLRIRRNVVCVCSKDDDEEEEEEEDEQEEDEEADAIANRRLDQQKKRSKANDLEQGRPKSRSDKCMCRSSGANVGNKPPTST